MHVPYCAVAICYSRFGVLFWPAVSARIRTLLETQQRLTADFAAAQKMQQQKHDKAAEARNTATSELQPVDSPAPDAGSIQEDSHDTYVTRLGELLSSTAPVIDKLQKQLEDLITKFRWTAEYYCEDVEKQAWKQQPVSFLTHFLDLLDSLSATQKDKARLTRVTTMLAEYVETEKTRSEQRDQELQVLEQSADDQQQAVVAVEEPEDPTLLLQQQLLRQHAASSGVTLPMLDKGVQQPDISDGRCVPLPSVQQRSSPVVPRLPLGGTTTPGDHQVATEVSWGSDSVASSGCGVGSSGPAIELTTTAQVHAAGSLSADCGNNPVRRLGFGEEGSSATAVDDNDHVEGLLLATVACSTAAQEHGSSTRAAADAFNTFKENLRSSVASAPDELMHLGQLAAAAAAAAQKGQIDRHGAAGMSMSLDSSSWSQLRNPATGSKGQQHYMQPTCSSTSKRNSSSKAPGAEHRQQVCPAVPQHRQQPQTVQQLGGQSATKHPATAVGGRKWTAADAQLAAAAAAAATVKQLSGHQSSPNKLTPQQQRLESLRLRGHRRSPP